MKSTPKKHFYTLVEILTVIVIAAILFGIGIPAFTTMIQGSNMTVAIRQLSSKISAARAYAVTNRCRVAVLLVEDENISKINPDSAFSAYRVCVIEDNNLNFQNWIEDEEWKLLPKGILRKKITSGNENIAQIPKGSVDNIFGDLSDEFVSLKALVFKKDGQLTQSCNIELYHGRYIKNGTSLTQIPTGGTDHKLKVEQYSGKVKVTAD